MKKYSILNLITTKGTTYLVLNYGIFVCTSCSGLHREINNKVKAFGVSNFTDRDIELVLKSGNDVIFQ